MASETEEIELFQKRERIKNRIHYLETENAKAHGWGAAVAARNEEIVELKSQLHV